MASWTNRRTQIQKEIHNTLKVLKKEGKSANYESLIAAVEGKYGSSRRTAMEYINGLLYSGKANKFQDNDIFYIEAVDEKLEPKEDEEFNEVLKRQHE